MNWTKFWMGANLGSAIVMAVTGNPLVCALNLFVAYILYKQT